MRWFWPEQAELQGRSAVDRPDGPGTGVPGLTTPGVTGVTGVSRAVVVASVVAVPVLPAVIYGNEVVVSGIGIVLSAAGGWVFSAAAGGWVLAGAGAGFVVAAGSVHIDVGNVVPAGIGIWICTALGLAALAACESAPPVSTRVGTRFTPGVAGTAESTVADRAGTVVAFAAPTGTASNAMDSPASTVTALRLFSSFILFP